MHDSLTLASHIPELLGDVDKLRSRFPGCGDTALQDSELAHRRRPLYM